MITLITGVVGSGKTLFCVEELLKLKSYNSTYKDVDYIYSNIANFKEDVFKDTHFQYFDLNLTNFYEHLKQLYILYNEAVNNAKSDIDEILLDYCKKNHFNNCFIIFDEAHNFFDNQDKIKVWYLTYHRHLHHNIFMITQNKMLINTKYRRLPEVFIKALPKTKRLGNDFKYNTYVEFEMKTKVDTVTVKNREELFSMYTSGNFTKQKNYSKKALLFFLIPLVLVVVLIIAVFKLMYSNTVTEKKEKKEVNKIEKKEVNEKVITENIENAKHEHQEIFKRNKLKLTDEFEVLKIYFYSDSGFKVFGNFYSIEHFKTFLDYSDSSIISNEIIFKSDSLFIKTYFIRTTQTFLTNFFIRSDLENNKNLNKLSANSKSKSYKFEF